MELLRELLTLCRCGEQDHHTLQGLTEGVRYHIVIVGYDTNRVEGTASAETLGWVLAASAVSTSSLATNSAVVSWQTNKPADSQVEYGTTAAYGSMTTLDSTRLASHSQTLTNLQPATTYQFRVRSKDEGGSTVVSPNFTFTTKSSGYNTAERRDQFHSDPEQRPRLSELDQPDRR